MDMEETSGPDAAEMLQQGQTLCTIGESLIAAAKAMGAESEEADEGEYSEESEDDESEEVDMKPDPKGKQAIIMAIRKKMVK